MNDQIVVVKQKKNLEQRNYGIDLLRFVAAFYVIILHSLRRGGLIFNVNSQRPVYFVLMYMHIIAYCAVDIFVMISGYVGYSQAGKSNNWFSLFSIWLQIVFYGLLIHIGYSFFVGKTIIFSELNKYFFPLFNNIYWYLCAYWGLFIIKPFLDIGIQTIGKRESKSILAAIIIFLVLYSSFVNIFYFHSGYCFAWFIVLYIIGGVTKKNENDNSLSLIIYILLLLGVSLLTLILVINGCEIIINGKKMEIVSYVSPFILFIGYLHLVIFSKIKISPVPQRIITLFNGGALSAYLLNTHPVIWNNVMNGLFIPIVGRSGKQILFYLLSFSFLFVFFSVLIDKCRQLLFEALHIRKVFTFFSTQISSRFFIK